MIEQFRPTKNIKKKTFSIVSVSVYAIKHFEINGKKYTMTIQIIAGMLLLMAFHTRMRKRM